MTVTAGIALFLLCYSVVITSAYISAVCDKTPDYNNIWYKIDMQCLGTWREALYQGKHHKFKSAEDAVLALSNMNAYPNGVLYRVMEIRERDVTPLPMPEFPCI